MKTNRNSSTGKHRSRRLALASTLAAALCAVSSTASAQWKPTKPVHVISPYAAGGPGEAILRSVTEPLNERLGQPLIIEARPGGGQSIAGAYVAKAPADGQTVLWAASAIVIAPLLGQSSFDIKELVPVVHIGDTLLMLVVNPSLNVSSVAELIKFAKANPAKASYGFAGSGSSMQLAGELMKSKGDFDMVPIAYKGSAQLLPDLLADRVPIAIDAITTLKPHVATGKLKILALTGRERSDLVPGVPTLAESGFPGFNVSPWNGFFVPQGTPRDVIVTLNRETNTVIKAPGFAENLGKVAGGVPRGGTPEQFAELIRNDTAQFAQIIRSAGIKAD